MKTPTTKRITSLAISALILSLSSMAFAQGLEILSGEVTMKVAPKKSNIKFTSEAPAEKIEGTVEEGITGSFTMNMDDLSKTTGSVALPVKNMNTGNKLRDKHMRSDDWLNAEKHPTITFTIESLDKVEVAKVDGKKQSFKAVAVGKININGVDAPAKAGIKGTALDSGKLKIKIDRFSVKLADHKVAGKKGVVGNKVGESIEIEGIIYAGK